MSFKLFYIISEILVYDEYQPFRLSIVFCFPASYVHGPPDGSLSPSPLLFVSHCPNTRHLLPNSSISLLEPSSARNVRVLEVQTFILGLQLSTSRRPCGFGLEISC